MTITEVNSRNLLRNVSSSRYKFNAERRLCVNRMQLQQQCACAKTCVKKNRKVYNLLYNAVKTNVEK